MLDFLYTAVSWVLLRWHQLFTLVGLDKNSGLNWSLSIVFLVITARLLLVRLFIKQVHYQRKMQEMQPKIKKLQEKYKGDRQTLQQEMMKLQQEEGFNPLSGCLPMVLQIPVFIGLFHVLRHIAAAASTGYQQAHPDRLTLYSFSKDETLSAAKAKLFGAPLASSFHDATSKIQSLGGDPATTRSVIVVLLLVSAAATFSTQLLVRSAAPVAAEGSAATIQRLMLYVIPVGVLASGLLFNFPLGVLLYWFTSNLWTLGQQGYIMRFHPHPDKATGTAPVKELGKSLAPKPGARPVRMNKGGATEAAAGSDIVVEPDDEDTTTATDTDAGTGPKTPRPGQKPNRPANKRPSGKRPSQTKKRR